MILMLNPRDPTIVANKSAMKSFENSKTDFEIFSGLAKKLGFLESFTENKSEMDWINLFGIKVQAYTKPTKKFNFA